MASHPIYQFYAELDDCKPKIWRRFQVTDDITVARLGYILQVLFEMKASHLMELEVPVGDNHKAFTKKKHPEMFETLFAEYFDDIIYHYEIIYDDLEPYNLEPYVLEPYADTPANMLTYDATKVKIDSAVSEPGDKINFHYDFGDDWRVTLTLEKAFTDKVLHGSELPRVLDGAGFGIVGDVGGVGGLADLAKAFKKKKGPDYREFSKWLGVKDLDLSAFDLEDMNFRLKKIPRIYKQCYEDRITPTQYSINLIERKYLKKRHDVT